MKVLILGANGFIGLRLLNFLLGNGVSVRALTRSSLKLQHGLLETVVGDLTDQSLNIGELVEDCSVVFNCAGEIRNEHLMRQLHVDVIRRAMIAIGAMASTNNPIHWVQLSSVGAYGPTAGHARVVTEITPHNPKGMYEKTKTDADIIIMNASAKNDNYSWTVVRPSNVFGPGMPNNSLRQLAAIVRKRLFFYIGYSQATATYIHVDDVVALLFLCGNNPRAKNQIFNISNDCPLNEMITAMTKFFEVPEPRLRIPETLVRLGAYLFSGIRGFPVTQQRIDALVGETLYSNCKVENVLGFSPEKKITVYIRDIF